MESEEQRLWQTSGVRRLRNAIHHQFDGILYGLRHDSAIRQVSIASIVLCIVALFLPVSRLECLLLVLSSTFLALVEYINPLSKRRSIEFRLSPTRCPSRPRTLGASLSA